MSAANGSHPEQAPGDSTSTASTRERVLDCLRAGESFLLVTHEHPDGDALGSLIAMHGALRALHKDVVMFMAPSELPLPYEYRFFAVEEIETAIPADLDRRIVVFLDCGNIDRNPAQVLRDAAALVNLDHHHDNTRFGTIDHVDPGASCTAEIVWDLMQGLGVAPTREVADALYVGLVTDTGRFMYENTGRRAHEMAADLIEAGVDVQAMSRRLYEGVPFPKLDLLGRALGRVQRFDDGRLVLTVVTDADYEASGAEEGYTEGIIDHLRALQGARVAVLVRDLLAPDRTSARKVSLRSADGTVDVSAIAREQGGGGHRQAAGFSTDLELAELIAFLRTRVTPSSVPTGADTPQAVS